jgi:hypothetical protein
MEYGRLVEDDHWPAIEIDQLREDLEEALIGEAVAKQKHSRACDDISDIQWKFSTLKTNFDKRISDTNARLSDKCMILLDLVAEYEKVLIAQAQYGGVKITTTKIKHLRKKGELDV